MSEPALRLLQGVRWHETEVPGSRSHTLLAALVTAWPASVSGAGLVQQIWDSAPPEHPDKALQVLVSRTRARTSPEAVSTGAAGYRLGLREDEVDALRLQRLLLTAQDAVRAGDLDVARLAAQSVVDTEVSTGAADGPLSEVVTGARQARRTAAGIVGTTLLALGNAEEALPLLEATLFDDPSDEARRVQVLRAVAAVRGIPAALADFAAYAGQVRERLGVEPGEELRRLHLELLARDAPVRTGLRYDATPMIGRDPDVTAVRGLLTSSRVVSIVGAGGLGKTRLAHLVGRLAPQPVVHFVELAGVTAPEGVLPEIAASIGVRDTTNTVRAQRHADLRSRIATQLATAPSLLVLDNCEHLVETVAEFTAFLVGTTQGTDVLTTSRAPLGIAAERVFLLSQLGADDAVELFEQRARAARADVRLEREEVRELTERLDGLPLAIELAAAKVRLLSVADITRRLSDRFALLTGGDRSAPDRHRTLEAVIAWSWNLLRPDDRRAMQRLAVFPDGFGLDGAAAVLGADPLGAVAELVDQSLLVVHEGDAVRYRFLETVREYAVQQLAGAGETRDAEEALHSWAYAAALDHARHLFGPDQIEVVRAVRPEVGNFAAVLRTVTERGEAELAVPLAAILTGFWTIEGEHLTVLGLCGPTLDLLATAESSPEQGPMLRAVLVSLAVSTMIFNDSPSAAAVRRIRELGLTGEGGRVDAMCRLMLEVHPDGALPDLDALRLLCADPDPRVAALANQWACQLWENLGELDDSWRAGNQARELLEDGSGPWTPALLLSQLGGVAVQRGDWDEAVRLSSTAAEVMAELGAEEDEAQTRTVALFADIAQGRLAQAEVRAAELRERLEGKSGFAWMFAARGASAELALATGQIDEGLRSDLEGLDEARRMRPPGMPFDGDQPPWVQVWSSWTLFAHVAHGGAERIGWLAAEVGAGLGRVLSAEPLSIDYPVVGGSVLALGSWCLARGRAPGPAYDAAARLIALGYRFGYHRMLPTLVWENVRRVIAGLDPGYVGADPSLGVVDALVSAYAERASVTLGEEAREAVELTQSLWR